MFRYPLPLPFGLLFSGGYGENYAKILKAGELIPKY
jgi:hypothetical protein